MKTLIRLEEFAMLLFGIFVFSTLPFAWWWFLVLILAPDVSMIGYTVSKNLGAVLYNLIHHKGTAIAIMIIGYYLRNDVLILAGAILFAHSSMDRIFGYGLKYFKGFKYTHLGELGQT